MGVVELIGLSKTFPGGIRAVADLTLRIEPGEWLVLVGPSGCGKTTTLRIVAGLETPSAGRVVFNGRDVTREPPHRRDVGMVFQRPALYPHLSVRDNLAFGLRLRGADSTRSEAEIPSRVHDIAELLHLQEMLDRRPRELSGGQQQRVALGRALVRRPAVLLLDEPLGGLDARLRMTMRRELPLLLHRLPATMLYVTHDQDEALALGHRVAVLDGGVLQQVDRPAVLVERPVNRFVAGFLGWPPMSFLDGDLTGEPETLRFRGLSAPRAWLPFRGRRIYLGLRADHVRLPRDPAVSASLVMDVRQVEALGSDRLVTLTREGWTLLARCDGSLSVALGSNVEVSVDLSRAQLFDQATGRALSHGGEVLS